MNTRMEILTTPATSPGGSPRSLDCIVLVDPVSSGTPFLESARQLGYHALPVFTLPPGLVARFTGETGATGRLAPLFANEVAVVLAELCRRGLDVAAVVGASEPGVRLADELAASVGLPHNPVRSVPARRDKVCMRRRGRAVGVPQPEFRVRRSVRGIVNAGAELGFPVIVKAPTGAGSHNVFLVSGPDDLARLSCASANDLFGTKIERWLVEQYVRGTEIVVNTLSYAGQHVVLDGWEKLLPTAADYDMPYWDACQLTDDSPRWPELTSFAHRVLDAYDIRFGPCHIELKYGGDGPVLLEIGARLPGAHIAEAWRDRCGADAFAATIQSRMGRRPELLDTGLRRLALLGAVFFVNNTAPGRLTGIYGRSELIGHPGVVDVHVDCRVGDVVPVTTDLASILGVVSVAARDRAALREVQKSVRQTMKFEVSP
jgi:biotin carboxylase